MNITLECHYCGSEDVKVTLEQMKDPTITIKCKCGRFLVRQGIMGHKDNVKPGDRVRHIKYKWRGVVLFLTDTREKAVVTWDGQYSLGAYAKKALEVDCPEGIETTEST